MSSKQTFTAKIETRFLLNQPGSSKETWHVTLKAQDKRPAFQVGDSIAIYPKNDPIEITASLRALALDSSLRYLDPRKRVDLTLQEILCDHYNIQALPERASQFLQIHQQRVHQQRGVPEGTIPHTLSEWLHGLQLTGKDLAIEEFLTKLQPLLPRFYSIASTPLQSEDEIELMVAKAWYEAGGQKRFGICSHYLTSHAHEEVTAYIQPTRHFIFPDDPYVPLILIGPGTGLAPFRAYLQDRLKKQHTCGRVWLFFGERQQAYDYFYSDFWERLKKEQFFHMSVAFSRDHEHKVYVQHKLWEERKVVWDWLQEGGRIYVCGDAKNMARDVEKVLLDIFTEILKSPEKALEYLKELRSQGRYLRDIY